MWGGGAWGMCDRTSGQVPLLWNRVSSAIRGLKKSSAKSTFCAWEIKTTPETAASPRPARRQPTGAPLQPAAPPGLPRAPASWAEMQVCPHTVTAAIPSATVSVEPVLTAGGLSPHDESVQ